MGMEDLKMISPNSLRSSLDGDLSTSSSMVCTNHEGKSWSSCWVGAVGRGDGAYCGCEIEHNELVNRI